MALTDLTGTKWEFNQILNFDEESNDVLFDLKFESEQNEMEMVGSVFEQLYIDNISMSLYFFVRSFEDPNFQADTDMICAYSPNASNVYGDITIEYDDNGWIQYHSNFGYFKDSRIITIVEGNDVTNPDCIAWFQANATQILDPVSLLTVTYNNTEIKSMTDYGTFTLNTKGKFCQYDIVLSLNLPEEKTLITFTIYYPDFLTPYYLGENGDITRTYQAEEGMTWAEWVESEYNYDDVIYIENSTPKVSPSYPLMDRADNYSRYQNSNDIVYNNHEYFAAGGGLSN